MINILNKSRVITQRSWQKYIHGDVVLCLIFVVNNFSVILGRISGFNQY